jgi:hypothetical protein
LGERLLCKQEVIGSIPFTSTGTSTGDRQKGLAKRAGKGGRKILRSRAEPGELISAS